MDLSGLSTQNLLRDYHYETREQIRKNYPRNSYRIMDYETAHMNELLQHQSGKEKQGGMKRRGGGGGGGKKKPGGKKHRGGGGGGGKKKQGGKKRRGGGGGEEGSGTGDGNNDSGLPEGGGNPGDREDGPPVLPPDTERKRRGFSVPDVSFDATTVAAVVMGGGDLHVQAYVRDDKGGVSMVEPLSLLQGPHGANEDGMVQVARSYLPTVRKMAEYVVPGITPGQVLVLAANAAFVTSEAVNSHRRRDSGHSTGPTAILGPSQIACPSEFVEKTSDKQLVQHVKSLGTTLKEHVVDVQNFFETLVYTAMKFDRSVADEDKRKLIATMVNATMLFIVNIFDQYKLGGT